MAMQIYCAKLKKQATALPRAPYPGALGERILASISQEAWQQWLAHQTMLINEYRLNALEASAREFLQTEMDRFLFGEGSAKPAQYQPPESPDA